MAPSGGGLTVAGGIEAGERTRRLTGGDDVVSLDRYVELGG